MRDAALMVLKAGKDIRPLTHVYSQCETGGTAPWLAPFLCRPFVSEHGKQGVTAWLRLTPYRLAKSKPPCDVFLQVSGKIPRLQCKKNKNKVNMKYVTGSKLCF